VGRVGILIMEKNKKLLIKLKIYGIAFIISVLISLFLSTFAMFNVIKESGRVTGSTVCKLSVYVAFWPSMVFFSGENDSLFTLSNWIISGIGWTIVICGTVCIFRHWKRQ
jgi:hypothetical protein